MIRDVTIITLFLVILLAMICAPIAGWPYSLDASIWAKVLFYAATWVLEGVLTFLYVFADGETSWRAWWFGVFWPATWLVILCALLFPSFVAKRVFGGASFWPVSHTRPF